jgi:hypothetical protein
MDELSVQSCFLPAPGSSVVAFNWGIHEIRDLMDLLLPVPVAPGARALAVPVAWPNLLAVPVMGALAVGGVKALMETLEVQKQTSRATGGAHMNRQCAALDSAVPRRCLVMRRGPAHVQAPENA